MPRKQLISIIFLTFFVASNLQALTGIPTVIDGDTIEIHKQRIRLNGIDAFESSQKCELNGKIYLCGSRSANYLSDLIARRTVNCTILGKDRYKRLLGICSVGTTNLNKEMVRAGWALAFVRYSKEYVRDEYQARLEANGAWAGRFAKPWDYRANKHTPLATFATKDSLRPPSIASPPNNSFIYPSCRAVRAAGASPIKRGEPGFGPHLDRDKDGIGCE